MALTKARLLKHGLPVHGKMSKRGPFSISIDFGAIFLWGPKWHFSDFKIHFWGFGVLGLCRGTGRLQAPQFGGIPTIPDPHTSVKVSRYKWEAYRDTNWGGVYTSLCQEEGMLLQKYRDRNGRCITILFKNIGLGVDVTLLNNWEQTLPKLPPKK